MYGLHLIKNLAGSYNFVGTVPVGLRYTCNDGSPLTEAMIKTIQRNGSSILFQSKQIRSVTFPDAEAATAAAAALGVTVN